MEKEFHFENITSQDVIPVVTLHWGKKDLLGFYFIGGWFCQPSPLFDRIMQHALAKSFGLSFVFLS